MKWTSMLLTLTLPVGALAGRDLYVTSYGADARGQRDSTAAFEAALSVSLAGDRVIGGNGRYIISRPLVMKDGVELIGYLNPDSNGELVWNGDVGLVMLQIGGQGKVRDLILNGRRRARVGLEVRSGSQGVVLEGVEVTALRGTPTASAYGILVSPGSGTASAPIQLKASAQRKLRVFDIDGPGNGKEGDSIGANRGIYINQAHATIDSCTIDRIGPPEDGDAIHVQAPGKSVATTISNCTITNFEKRGIKIQAHGVRVLSNTIYTSSPHANAGIEVIGAAVATPAKDVVIRKNHVIVGSAGAMAYGISVVNGSGAKIEGNSIDLQSIATKADNGAISAVMLLNSIGVSVHFNTISQSSWYGVQVNNSSNNSIKGNYVDVSIPLGRRIQLVGSSINNQIQAL